MPDQSPPAPVRAGSMRVFVSWSGERSKALAHALKDWLPLVLYYVEPWMSEASIDAGERWGVAVSKELEASNFGIICVTRENLNAPWVLFEAGALAKSLQDSRVIPLLLDLDFKDISGPLAQFQAKKAEKAGVLEVVRSINQAASHAVPEARANDLFEALWPKLEAAIAAIPKPAASAKSARPTNEVIEELVTGVRALEGRVRELNDEPRNSRRRQRKFHPFMVHEVSSMLGGRPGDSLSMLVIASYLRDDLPWLYELAVEAYRTVREGNRKQAIDAARRFHRALNVIERGPFPLEEFGIDPHTLHMLLREWRHLADGEGDDDADAQANGSAPSSPSLERGKTIK